MTCCKLERWVRRDSARVQTAGNFGSTVLLMSDELDSACTDGGAAVELTGLQDQVGARPENTQDKINEVILMHDPKSPALDAYLALEVESWNRCALCARGCGKCCCCLPSSCWGRQEDKIVGALKVFDAVAKVTLGVVTATSGFKSRAFFIMVLIFRTFFGGFVFADAMNKCVAYLFEIGLPMSGKSSVPPSDKRWPGFVRALRAVFLLLSPILICVPFMKASAIEPSLRRDTKRIWGERTLPKPVGVAPNLFAWAIGPFVSLSTIFKQPDVTKTYKTINTNTGEKPPRPAVQYSIFDYRNEPFPTTLNLDAYMPYTKSLKPPNGLWPVVVYFHGGGWTYRNRKDIPVTVVEFLRERGVAFVSVEYRLLQHGWNGSHILSDTADAMAYLHSHGAKELGVDANRTVLMGNSAGGHLALMTGFTSPPDQVVRGIVDFCAVKPSDTDFATDYPVTSSYFKFTENKEWMKRYFAPTMHVGKMTPPVLMVHGMDDVLVPISTSYHLAEVLKNNSVKHQLIAVPGQIHACEIEPFSPCSQYAAFGLQSFLSNVLGTS